MSGDVQGVPLIDTFQYVEEIEHRGHPQYLESEVIVLSRINTSYTGYLLGRNNSSNESRHSQQMERPISMI